MGLSTSTNTNNSISDYSTNKASIGNIGIITTANINNSISNRIDNSNEEVETIDLDAETNYRGYFKIQSSEDLIELYRRIAITFKECENVDINDLSEEEQAMVYYVLLDSAMEDSFDDIESISFKIERRDESVFTIKFNDGTIREFGADNRVAGRFRQINLSTNSLSKEEIKEISRDADIRMFSIDTVIDNGDSISVTLINGTTYKINKDDHIITDIYDKDGNSIVEDIGMFTDEAAEYGLYGGAQANLINNFYDYKDDKQIQEIIKNYFPNENLSDDDLKLLFAKMNDVGCGYVAMCNTIFQLTEKLSDDEFKEKFGFDRHRIQRTSDGKYIRTYNYDYMFLDFFMYYQTNYAKFKSISDIIGDVTTNENGDMVFAEDTGAQGNHSFYVEDCFKQYAKDRNIKYKSSSTAFGSNEMYNYDFGNKIFNFFDGLLEFYNPFNNAYIRSTIESSLKEGKSIVVDMRDFTMCSPEDLDGNGKLDDVVKEDVGGHAMLVLGTTDDGGYIVSSWGKKYIVYPKADNFYHIISKSKETLETMTIYE